MADISITFTNPTPEETRAAQHELARVNAVRVAHGESEFANIKEHIIHHIETALVPEWIEREANAKRQDLNVRALWRNASDTERAAAIAALQGGE